MSLPPEVEARLLKLEKQVYQNRRQLRRAKNAKAILVLGVVLFMVAEFDLPLPWGGRIKTSRLQTGDVTQIILMGAWAVGAIALEDLLSLKTSKPSERDGKEDEREG